MTLVAFLVLLAVAGICGAVGSAIAGHGGVGCLGSIALGFIGAALGMWIAREMHLPTMFVWRVGGERFPVVWSIAGSALFVGLLSLLTRRRG